VSWVDVLGQEVKKEPVSNLWVVEYDSDVEPVSESRPRLESSVPQMREENDGDTIDQDDSSDDSEEDEPEPEEDVDLLIDNVEREDAESIMLLHVSWRTISVERTLGHSWEDFDHWINSVLLISLRVPDNIPSICTEVSSEESVNDVHLRYDVEEVEKLADHKVVEVTIVVIEICFQIVNDKGYLLSSFVSVHNGHIEVEYQRSQSPTFPQLPKVSRYIKHDSLEEEDKTHPLIVFVVDAFLFSVRSVLIDSRMRDLLPDSLVVGMRKGEGRMDPTIGIYNIWRDVVSLNTIDWISEVLTTSDEEGEGDEEDHGCFVMQAEYIVVDAHLV